MEVLDFIEGHPVLYKRTEIVVTDEEDSIHRCWSYIGTGIVNIDDCIILKDGIYKG